MELHLAMVLHISLFKTFFCRGALNQLLNPRGRDDGGGGGGGEGGGDGPI